MDICDALNYCDSESLRNFCLISKESNELVKTRVNLLTSLHFSLDESTCNKIASYGYLATR